MNICYFRLRLNTAIHRADFSYSMMLLSVFSYKLKNSSWLIADHQIMFLKVSRKQFIVFGTQKHNKI